MHNEPIREHHSLVYPRDRFDPKDLLNFVQLHGFTESFKDLELTDDEQRELEVVLMTDPTISPVIRGTGGMRELKCGVPHKGPGSLHLSIFYAYFPEKEEIVLVDVFVTETLAPMTDTERAELKALFEECQRECEG